MTTVAPIGIERVDLIAQGRRAVDALIRSALNKDDGLPVETNIGSLRGLGELIGLLLDEVERCGGADCFGRMQDGIRFWVAREQLEAQTSRAACYASALRTIALARSHRDGDLAMLVDWQSVAEQLIVTAEESLREAG